MKKLVVSFVIILFLVPLLNADQWGVRAQIDALVAELRQDKEVRVNGVINPDKVSNEKLEKLGGLLLVLMSGDDGGTQGADLRISVARNYLSGDFFDMPMGFGGMMRGGFGPGQWNYNYYRGGMPMMWGAGSYGMGGWMFGGAILLFILFIAVPIILVIIFAYIKKPQSPDSTSETPMEILKKRYAKGEISREEFEKMKSDLM